jgi:putative DNA primase/helicase
VSTATPKRIRHTAAHPCPVCEGHEELPRGHGERCCGWTSANGWAHCSREESDKPDRNGTTWSHRLAGRAEPRPRTERKAGGTKGRIVATYPYRDERGEMLYEVVRFDPKDFRQRRPDPDFPKNFKYSLGDVRRVLYRLPELVAADPAEWVCVVEGEKDADRLAELGMVATTCAMGAGKWQAAYSSSLKSRKVAIIPDADEPGRAHAEQVARSVAKVAAEVRVIELPRVELKEDVSDWLDLRGGSLTELLGLIEDRPTWRPARNDPAPPIANQAAAPPDGDDRPAIVSFPSQCDDGFKVWAPKALEAMALRNRQSPRLFQRGGVLCRVRPADDGGSPMIEHLTIGALRGELDRAAHWGVEIDTKRGPVIRWGPPRLDVAQDILSLPEYDRAQFPVLDSVVESPRFTAAGRLVVTPGYDPESRLLYSPLPDVEGVSVPDVPTTDDLDRALSLVFDDLLFDFPFANEASRANALAVMLLPFVREMIPGPTPNHHFSASTEGTGKGLLANACAFPSRGRVLEIAPQKEDEAEWRKAITSMLMRGESHFFLDNMANPRTFDGVHGDVDSGTLAAVWTAERWTDRILGSMRECRVPVRVVWMSSGNNVCWSRELTRRLVMIELVSPVENPSLRDGFKHAELMKWATAHRRDLVWACLTIVQHWIAQGRPAGSVTMGSFEVYAKVMGGILEAAGVQGFLGNRPRMVERNPEAERWVTLVETWHAAHDRQPVATATLHEMILASQELRELFAETIGDGKAQSQKVRLGKALERHENRVWGRWRVVRSQTKERTGVARWKLADPSASLELVAQASEPETDDQEGWF